MCPLYHPWHKLAPLSSHWATIHGYYKYILLSGNTYYKYINSELLYFSRITTPTESCLGSTWPTADLFQHRRILPTKWSPSEDLYTFSVENYHEAVGALILLSKNTRRDLAVAVKTLSNNFYSPTNDHLKAVLRVMKCHLSPLYFLHLNYKSSLDWPQWRIVG